jgi:hypothetical protein
MQVKKAFSQRDLCRISLKTDREGAPRFVRIIEHRILLRTNLWIPEEISEKFFMAQTLLTCDRLSASYPSESPLLALHNQTLAV